MLRVLPRRPTKTNLATLLVERGWQYAQYRYSTLCSDVAKQVARQFFCSASYFSLTQPVLIRIAPTVVVAVKEL